MGQGIKKIINVSLNVYKNSLPFSESEKAQHEDFRLSLNFEV